jgi:transcriptional regulator with XRE-family HTH domain
MAYDGGKLKELREREGWTQDQLATKAKSTGEAVERYEKGESLRTKTKDFAAAFGMDLNEFREFVGIPVKAAGGGSEVGSGKTAMSSDERAALAEVTWAINSLKAHPSGRALKGDYSNLPLPVKAFALEKIQEETDRVMVAPEILTELQKSSMDIIEDGTEQGNG